VWPTVGVRQQSLTQRTLKFEHLYRAPIDHGGALTPETARLHEIYNTTGRIKASAITSREVYLAAV
jgi:hypothetical protein